MPSYPYIRKRSFFGSLVLGLLFWTAIFWWRASWLPLFAQILVRDDAVKSPGVVLILGGNLLSRPQKAAEIVKSGMADQVLWMRTQNSQEVDLGLCPTYQRSVELLLTRSGIPRGKFRFLDTTTPVQSTIDEAKLFKKYVTDNKLVTKHVYLVTSWFHTRRARWTFHKQFKDADIMIDTVAAYDMTNPSNWWRSEQGFLEVYTEYLKWIYHLLHGIFGRKG